MLESFALAHRPGEMDVEAQLVLGQLITAWIDLLHGGRVFHRLGEHDPCGQWFCASSAASRDFVGMKNCAVAEARRQRKTWLEADDILLNTVGAQNRGPVRSLILAGYVNRKHRLPLILIQASQRQFRQIGCSESDHVDRTPGGIPSNGRPGSRLRIGYTRSSSTEENGDHDESNKSVRIHGCLALLPE